MKVGDRVRLSEYGKEYLDWPEVVEGTIVDGRALTYDVTVQWDVDRDEATFVHYENELEVIS